MRARLTTILAAAILAAACGHDASRLKPGNVVLITLDTTRADHLGAWGYSRARTPRLDALAREGVRFAKEFSSVPLTLPAHSALMTGTTPPFHGVRDNGGFFLADARTTLAEVLKAHGFATAAFVGAFVLNRHWGLSQGFDVYDDAFGPDDPQAAADLHAQRDGKEVADHALEWLEANRSRPFFAWLHFYDAHWPYEPKGELAEAFRDAPYDGEIAYVDAQVGRVLDWLENAGLKDTTLVVVTADHGEGLGEHGEPDHGIFAYDATLHVPLIVRGPGVPSSKTVEATTRDIDVMPTILDALGIAPPPEVRGRSLGPLLAGSSEPVPRAAYAESFYVRYHYGWKEVTAFREGRFKLIDLPHVELYDLDQDPGETDNLATVHPERVAEMRAALGDLKRQAGSGANVPDPAAIDPEALARLQALGYIGATAKVGEGELADPKDKLRELDLIIKASRETSEAMRSGRYADAAATVEKALAAEPNYVDGWQFLGSAYLKLGRPDEAIAALKHVLEANPDSPSARMTLARAHSAKGENDVAAALADGIIAANARYVAAYYAASDALCELGRFDDALARMKKLSEARPDATGATYEIARILLRAGRPDQAEPQIRKALAENPKTRTAHFNLALIAEERGDPDTAAKEYEAEIAAYPDEAEALTNLGILRMQRGEVKAGVAAFERLVAAAPGDPRARSLLARARASEFRGQLPK